MHCQAKWNASKSKGKEWEKQTKQNFMGYEEFEFQYFEIYFEKIFVSSLVFQKLCTFFSIWKNIAKNEDF